MKMDKRALIVAAVILLIPVTLLGIWAVQGASMEDDFAEALRAGTVEGLHRDLQNKQWTPEELETVDVQKVPDGYGRERALARSIQMRDIVVSRQRYEYQATVRDHATDIIHVFGLRRDDPRQWCWDQIHPGSLQAHIERRLKQVEQMRDSTANSQSL